MLKNQIVNQIFCSTSFSFPNPLFFCCAYLFCYNFSGICQSKKKKNGKNLQVTKKKSSKKKRKRKRKSERTKEQKRIKHFIGLTNPFREFCCWWYFLDVEIFSKKTTKNKNSHTKIDDHCKNDTSIEFHDTKKKRKTKKNLLRYF